MRTAFIVSVSGQNDDTQGSITGLFFLLADDRAEALAQAVQTFVGDCDARILHQVICHELATEAVVAAAEELQPELGEP